MPRMPDSARASRIGPDLVRRAPVPVDRGARFDVGRGQGAVAADPIEELRHEIGMLQERLGLVPGAAAIPVDPIPRQLGGREDGEALVVGLEQDPLVVEELVGPLAPESGDPRRQQQVVVAPRDVERVELERAEPIHDPHDRGSLRGQRSRRRQEMAAGHEPARGGAVHGEGRGHRPMVRDGRDRRPRDKRAADAI